MSYYPRSNGDGSSGDHDMNRIASSATTPNAIKSLAAVTQGTGLLQNVIPPTRPSTSTPVTTANLIPFITSLLPNPNPKDVNFLYHTPRSLPLSPKPISRVVLSITPTSGFYPALRASSATNTLGFLHRPWNLERRRVPPRSTILACHKGFDEVLTVGYNVALAAKLGMHVERSVCLQGYKGDPERRVGIVGPLHWSEGGGEGMEAKTLLTTICTEFAQVQLEGSFGFDNEPASPTPAATGVSDTGESGKGDRDDESGGVPLPQSEPALPRPSSSVSVLAIMNAFHPDEIHRVTSAALSAGFISCEAETDKILYLTGAIRPEGLAAALEKGMKVACVGHRVCEEWGIRWLASRIREEFLGSIEVKEVFEEEEVVEKDESTKQKKPKLQHNRTENEA